MPIASRTPEGWPNRCPTCGTEWRIEPSQPTGDAPCPVCGQLVWFDSENLRRRIEAIVARNLGIAEGPLYRPSTFWRFRDSMDVVELLLELEEEYDVNIANTAVERIRTVDELVEFMLREIEKRRKEG